MYIRSTTFYDHGDTFSWKNDYHRTLGMSTHEIVILGGNLGGLAVAHYLLKHVVPALPKSRHYHITVITPNKKAFFKIAAPRVIAAPSKISTSQILPSIDTAFSSYTGIDFVHGRATRIDPSTRTIEVSIGESVKYDSLVIATGSKYASDLWNSVEDDAMEKLYSEVHEQISKAQTILIAGGGAVGVELAAEVAENFPSKKVTLLTGSARPLPRLSEKSSRRATQQLESLGVRIMNNHRVTSQKKTGAGTTKITAGEFEEDTDVFIDATGGKPNSGFLPSSWLNENGYVTVNTETLRGTGPEMENVYAIGEVASYTTGSILDIQDGVKALASSIAIDLGLKRKQVSYKLFVKGQVVSIGSRGGVFYLGGWSLPSFFVWLLKSRDMMIGGAEKYIGGAKWD